MGTRIELSFRDRAILRAVAGGHAELLVGVEPDLYLDGRFCADQVAARRLAAGLIAGAVPGATAQRVAARLTCTCREPRHDPDQRLLFPAGLPLTARALRRSTQQGTCHETACRPERRPQRCRSLAPDPHDRPVDENWPTHGWPTAGYTREKAYVERVLDTFERDRPDIRVVRLGSEFIFKRTSAAAQRRLFAGPLLPDGLTQPGLISAVPDLPGLSVQALHSADAGQAYRPAVIRDVRSAFNIAADPVIDPAKLAEMLGASTV